MDFDDFEKAAQEKEKPTQQDTSCCGRRAVEGNGILDQFEDWEEYMQFGFAAGVGRDHFGFRLPYRTRNDQ